MPLLNAEEEVVLAKAIELGEQIVDEPQKAVLSLWEWTKNDTELKTRDQVPAAPPALQGRDRPHRARGLRRGRRRRPAPAHARPAPRQGAARRPRVTRPSSGSRKPRPLVGEYNDDADRRPLHRPRRLRLPRRAQHRPGVTRQPRPARALRLDARDRPRGAAALDHRRQRRRHHARDGLGPRRRTSRSSRATGAACWCASGARVASS